MQGASRAGVQRKAEGRVANSGPRSRRAALGSKRSSRTEGVVHPHAYLCLWVLSMPRSVMPRGSAFGRRSGVGGADK